MTPVDQQFMHDPTGGVFGDCQRACVASLLDLPAAAVPHFLFDGTKDIAEFNRRINAFLAPLGLMHLETARFDFQGQFRSDCFHLIYGESNRGFCHAVVGFNGEIVHDPHPSRDGLIDAASEDWTFAFLVRTGFLLGSALEEIVK